MEFPDHLRYTSDHEWVLLEGNVATIGITDFAQSELGDIVFVELEDIDSEFDQDDVFGSVEAVKTVSDLFMPVTGKVIAHNEKLVDNPELINTSPYDEGWMIKVEVADVDSVATLLTAADYTAKIGQ